MPNPMDPEFTGQNPIVAAAERIRARRRIGSAIDEASGTPGAPAADDAGASLRRLAERLAAGSKRLNAIVGERNGVKLVVLERPLRLRLRMGDRRLRLDLDDARQLIRIGGLELEGEYQFDPAADVPALINLSIISTDAGYGERLTASSLLKLLASEAELPPPEHLRGSGPLTF